MTESLHTTPGQAGPRTPSNGRLRSRNPLYFEDLAVGDEFVTPARTVTESDVVTFAGLSGDFNSIHTDAILAGGTAYGQRVVHGLLGLSILTGLLDRLRLFDGTAIAMLGVREWNFVNPVFIQDTVHGRLLITGLRRTRRGDRGIIERRLELWNARDELCQEGRIDLMIRCRDSVPPATLPAAEPI